MTIKDFIFESYLFIHEHFLFSLNPILSSAFLQTHAHTYRDIGRDREGERETERERERKRERE